MPRMARVVVPGVAHHVTQRGNRRQAIFFGDEDYRLFRQMLAEQLRRREVECWAYCLMPNHVHLLLTPAREDGLAAALGEVHRRYTAFINTRAGWTGHLFQGRFASVALDEAHLMAAARYVVLNPVRAGFAARAEEWPWSSATAHLAGEDDALVRVAPLQSRVPRFLDLLEDAGDGPGFAALRRSETTGRPLVKPAGE